MDMLNKEEVARLQKINDILNYRMTNSIMAHFREAGKLDIFADASTETEKDMQKTLMREAFSDSAEKSAVATAKIRDIFLGVTRRIDDDQTLAVLLPKNLQADDVPLLEKAGCLETAALVKCRVALG
jgi:hypothetical protein